MTLARRIIPCLDVDAGRVVKGIEFEGSIRCAAEGVKILTEKERTSESQVRQVVVGAGLDCPLGRRKGSIQRIGPRIEAVRKLIS